MPSPIIGHGPILKLTVAGVPELAEEWHKFEWKSFVNGGYIIRAQISDPYWNILRQMSQQYLQQGRRKNTEVEWEISWPNGNTTEKKKGVLTDLDTKGIHAGGMLEFIAVDPPSYFLNSGNVDGSVFEGTVKEVIEQVIQKYAPDIKFEVGKTTDYNKNKWWMMRQDPKTFIMSLLEWSSSITGNQTNWIVASGFTDLPESKPKIIIKEQSEIKGEDFGVFSMNQDTPGLEDVRDFEFLGDNFLTAFQTKLLTHGISAVSEKYLDKITDKDEDLVYIKDSTTTSKVNPSNFGADRGFAKPSDEDNTLNNDAGFSPTGGSAIMAVPEFNAGDLGIIYEKWIDGRARSQFLNMLRLVMRMKLRINGDPEFDDSTKLGVSTCTIQWFDADGANFFLGGRWLIYGWHHIVKRDDWYTDLYLTRLDFDASAKRV